MEIISSIKWTKTTGLKNLKKVNLMIMQAAKKEMSSFLKIKPSIKDSGKIALGTDKVFKSGQMELSIQVAGVKIKFKVRVNLFMQIKMNTKENFMPIEQTVLESMFKSVVKLMRDIGLMTNHMGKAN